MRGRRKMERGYITDHPVASSSSCRALIFLGMVARRVSSAYSDRDQVVCAVMTLYGNGLMDEGGTALGRVLLTNRTLTKLDLDDAGITVAGSCTPLRTVPSFPADALSCAPRQLTLFCKTQGIGPRGCAELCKGLAKNRVLQELNLQENRLGDEGFTALGNALATNTTLQQLALGGNQNHTDVGLIYLAHGIRRAAKRAAPLNLTGVDLAKVADIIGMFPSLSMFYSDSGRFNLH